jgi:hypothetical protein
MMDFLGFTLAVILLAALWFPNDVGRTAAKIHKAYLVEMEKQNAKNNSDD